jgi:hypothetical protein
MSYTTPLSIAKQRINEQLKFYPNNMPFPNRMADVPKQYVFWIDVMGSQAIMVRSIAVASNFMMKLHIAAIRASEEFPLQLFPVIDGLYACSPSQGQILSFINRIHSMLAVTFILENNQHFKFQVRCGLAYGHIIEGNKLLHCAKELQRYPLHTKSVLLGSAAAHAYQVEGEAAPFGVALHESVTEATSGISLTGKDLKWWKVYSRQNDDLLASELYRSLREHYIWCFKKSTSLGYEIQAINRHKAKADEYFAECITPKVMQRRYYLLSEWWSRPSFRR